jgi:flagellar biosynthesis GTPase FlhF
MKKLLFLILIVGVVILMALTKPDKKAHKEAMMKAIAEYVDDKAEDSGLGNNVLTDLGKGLVRSTISLAMDLKLKLDDYFVANATHIRLNGEDKMLSLGLFGKVITFDKEMLRDALENGDKLKQKDLTDPDDKEALREAKKAEKEFLKEAKKREKEAKKAAKEAEREAKKAAQKAEKEAKRMAREAEKAAKAAEREAKAAVKEAMQNLE